MANKKISELDSRASLSLSDLLAVGDPTTGYLYKITITDLKSLTGAGVISFNGRVGSVAPAEGDYTLNQLGDVIITSPTNGNILQYNGSNWVNATIDLSGYVPYTGATSNVNLGTYDLTADVITGATGSFASSGGSNTFAINHSSGSGIALSITKGGNGEGLYINKTSGSGNAATIVGTLEATTLVKSGGTSSQFLKADGSVDSSTYLTTSSASSTYVPLTRTLTINGTAFDLSADRTWTIPTHDAVTIGTANGLSLSGQALSLALASTSATGALSSTDWNTFNGKQDALTNPVTGTGTSGHVTYFTGSTSVAGSANHYWDATNNRLGIGLTNPQRSLEIYSATADSHLRLSGAAPTVSMGEAVTGAVYQAKFGLVTTNAQFVTGSLAGDFVIISQTGATIWATSGGEKMRLTSGGNLGIGTTAPGAALDVLSIIRATNNATTGLNSSNIQLAAHNGTSVVVSGSMFQTNSTFSYQQISPNQTNIYGTAANGMRIATANAPIVFSTGNSDADFSTERMRISSGGNVGIGTTSPTSPLHIGNTTSGNQKIQQWGEPGFIDNYGLILRGSSLDGVFKFYGLNNGTETTDPILSMNRSSGNVGMGTTTASGRLTINNPSTDGSTPVISIRDTTNVYEVAYLNFSQSTDMMTLMNKQGYSASGIAFGTNNTERMRISQSGNVLIGTTTGDGYKLQMVGSSQAQATFGQTYSGVAAYSQWVNSSGAFVMGLDAANGSTERMRITSGGNLNIGGNSGTGRIQVWGQDQTSSNYGMIVYDSQGNGLLALRNDRLVTMGGLVGTWTTGNAANVWANPSSGDLYRSTSSIKYKKNVQNYQRGLADVMQLRPVTYEGKNEIDNGRTFAGLIAEEVHELGLTEFVQYAEDGTPDALAYQNMIALAFKAIQELKAEINTLKNK